MITSLLVATLLAAPAVPESTSAVVLRVIVNTVDRGDSFLRRAASGDILVSGTDLARLGLHFPRPAPADSMVSLRSLPLAFQLEEHTATLHVTASPEMFAGHFAQLSRTANTPVQLGGENAAFLNYQLSHRFRSPIESDATWLSAETGLRLADWLGLSTFSAAPRSGWVRLNSSLIRDNAARRQRIVLGDSPTRSGRFGFSPSLAGVRVASEHALNRWLDLGPRQEVEGTVETPSDVEIFVNDVLVRREHVQPGRFHYSGLPLSAGAGTVSLRIRDAFGRERTITAPVYESTTLLRPGLSEYSFAIGFPRRGFGVRSFDYGSLALVGDDRVGLSKVLTFGAGIEAYPRACRLSSSADWILGSLAELQVSGAVSRHRDRYGTGWNAACVRRGRRVSAHVSLEGQSREYGDPFTDPRTDHLRLREAAGITLSHPIVGSISLQVVRTGTFAGNTHGQRSLTCSRGLGRSLSLLAGLGRSGAHVPVDAFAILNLQLGSTRSAGIDLRRTGTFERAAVHVEQSTPVGPGLGFRVRMDATDDARGEKRGSGLASASVQGRHGQYSLSLRDDGVASRAEMSLAGSAVVVQRSFHLSRPITDSFALVRVGRMQDVPVNLWNRRNGTTNRHGELLVPELVSNSENRISLDARDIPFEWNLPRSDRSVTLPFRSGGIVEFEAIRLQSFEGRVFVVRDGTPRPAEFATLEIEVGKTTIRSFVGKGGAFYFENLPAGSHAARLLLGDDECRFVITIPRSDAMTVNLGDIRCETRE